MKKSFASDNYAGALPEMLEAVATANTSHARSYGNDDYTAEAKREFERHFGSDIEVTFVFNGTGANVLGIGTTTQSFNAILCADISHMYVDESTAPERFTGCRLYALPTNADGKLEPETIRKKIIRIGDEHHPQISVLSIAQPTEYGTLYSIDELKAIKAVLKEHGLLLHMDGARLFNAQVGLGCSMEAMTKTAGVDILSVGGTKVGLLFGEAVVFFDKTLAKTLRFRQKQSMQLPSKMRFISAQFDRLLKDDLGIKSATYSNRMAQQLHAKLSAFPQIKITKPVQTNAVFAILPKEWIAPLQEEVPFYIWNEQTNEVRLMCAFDTTEEDIERFVQKIHELIG
ncbi:MAG: low specificity L-threonine aldolase [Bacteroidales bacterium]